jgi:predicted phosphodiesterase
LDAILEDIKAQGGADKCWILGDLVDAGPDPVAVLERISEMENVTCIRGNTDRYVVTADSNRFNHPGDPPEFDIEAAESIAWTQGSITQAGWFDWLLQLPDEVRVDLPDGTKVLGVHAAPGRDTGLGFHSELLESEYKWVIGDSNADIIFGGHHHKPLDVTINGQRIINVGSVSLHYPPDLRASYVILRSDNSGNHIEHRRVDYNHETVIETVERIRHPAANYIISLLRGQRRPSGRDYVQQHLNFLQGLSSL